MSTARHLSSAYKTLTESKRKMLLTCVTDVVDLNKIEKHSKDLK